MRTNNKCSVFTGGSILYVIKIMVYPDFPLLKSLNLIDWMYENTDYDVKKKFEYVNPTKKLGRYTNKKRLIIKRTKRADFKR